MRLTAIKLAGFKSFVDPTTIQLPSNLLGVVGPNGCGKSNIIDAVRWVMGESSARQLRGESMSDVIFSGSSVRKPVTTATVELIFDNSDGRAGGEFARYNEISVRRQVSRDGQSAYFLNGSRCRRKDITDLFLGTGLGPRSYAIIEQGMISQIVEARPEELRGFLEEAAGVSLYKERRRETENRIRHTRENLERLDDLRDEVTKQLARLKRQANAAERYRKLKQRYRDEEAALNALRWRQARGRLEHKAAELKQTETRIEQAVAAQREAEKALETLRERQHQAGENTSKIQAELYEVAGEIARVEQSIEHNQELLKRRRNEYREVEAQIDELKQHLVLDRTQVEEVTARLAELEPALNEARALEAARRQALDEADQALSGCHEQAQAARAEAARAGQQVELLKLRIEHLDERMNQGAQRLEKLKSEGGGATEKLSAEIAETERVLGERQRELDEHRERQASQRDAVAARRERIDTLRTEVEASRDRQRELRGTLESLRVLNQPDQRDADNARWLARLGLDRRPTLLESLDVDPDWQRAVETVLEAWLSARVSDAELPHALPGDGELALVRALEHRSVEGTLAAVARGAGALAPRLARVRLADSTESAFGQLESLAGDESLITRDGLWLGPGWIWRSAGGDAEQCRLARQQRIRALETELETLDRKLAAQEERLGAERMELEREADALEALRATADQLQAQVAETAGLRAGQRNRLEAQEKQRAAAESEIEALERRQAEDAESLAAARAELQQAMEALSSASTREREHESSRQQEQQKRDQCRSTFREAREAREQVALKLESARASLDSLKQAIQRMDTQIGQLQGRYVELSEALAQGDRPVREQQAERDELLKRRLEVEQRLKTARSGLEALEEEWREHDRERQQASARAEQVRQQQSEHRVRVRELEIEVERFAARVAELDADLEALVGELPDDAQADARIEELDRLEQSIRRLEPVNLAAIQEFEQESERKEYLDRQHADLVEALETLEQAIARIDRTTRTRYKDTFERVNANMEMLFPRLFGGGHAHVEMVGDDWLTAGAAIMARPPGKRISRIHLLSGGEKALTAVAFVFAIFNLNPAPFCLLDEVDAPLDDANVGRFSELVREMSEKVQFLFVTHNKVTMEVANQMIGVTMREPGISRMVSVDLEKAVALAAS